MSAIALTPRITALLALALLLGAASARGDGAHMQLTRPAGPFVITLFTAPTPLRSGPAVVSVLVQTPDRAPVRDASVDVTLRALGPDAHREITAAAHRGLLPNKLLYSAELVIPSMGRWSLAAHVRDGERSGDVSCEVDVATAMTPLVAFWGFIALPFVAIGIFALHQWLKSSTGRRRVFTRETERHGEFRS